MATSLAQVVVEALGGWALFPVPCSVRHMTIADYEQIGSFELGFDHLRKLDMSWIWVACRGAMVVGVLEASPVHGTVMVWRLVMLKDQPFSLLTKLLRTFLREIRERGYDGYMTLVDTSNTEQAKLYRIIERTGGKPVGMFTLIASPMPKEGI